MDYLVRENKNIIISRTFSKVYGLAGLSIGYLVLKPELANQLYGDYSPYGRKKYLLKLMYLQLLLLLRH